MRDPDAAGQARVGAGFDWHNDFCFVAAALYELLPATVAVGYFAIAGVYVLVGVASIVSHVPGGLAVLEAVVIHVLPEASVIGALVVFRFIYFLVSFTIGAVLFAACELVQRRGAFHS